MSNKIGSVQLNLARKWRSQIFQEVVGQDLSVRMLKNSLYKNHYFPVYLFCGQRGCGKTSTARIFAAAINCEQLTHFQNNPKEYIVPCRACASCNAMAQNKHPDFIEIDAASHTGVDNVRHLVDAASLLPLMGRKKVYLIDEAHMLSKAAFNAFLKVLEEPPASVLFILATTDPEKIIDTVRSRCFQLFFKPVELAPLLTHLQHVCKQEGIVSDTQALELIINETDGSVRDALNVLEQVRFSSRYITKQAVQQILGHIDDACLIQLFAILLQELPQDFLLFAQKQQLDRYNTGTLWRKIAECARAALWFKHGVIPKAFAQYHEQLKNMIADISWQKINGLLDALYSNEQLFLKTTDQYGFVEMVLLQVCQKNKKSNNSSGTPAAQTSTVSSHKIIEDDDEDQEHEEDEDTDDFEEEFKKNKLDSKKQWQLFLHKIMESKDPLTYSVFKQSRFSCFDQKTAVLTLAFSKQFSFFKELIQQTNIVWQPVIDQCFGASVTVNPIFNGDHIEVKPVIITPVEEQTEKVILSEQKKSRISTCSPRPHKQTMQSSNRFSRGIKHRETFQLLERKPLQLHAIDVSDKAQWPQLYLLQNYFAGTIQEVNNNN